MLRVLSVFGTWPVITSTLLTSRWHDGFTENWISRALAADLVHRFVLDAPSRVPSPAPRRQLEE
jgi:hypothetical protein